jgi:hypothetical protein
MKMVKKPSKEASEGRAKSLGLALLGHDGLVMEAEIKTIRAVRLVQRLVLDTAAAKEVLRKAQAREDRARKVHAARLAAFHDARAERGRVKAALAAEALAQHEASA